MKKIGLIFMAALLGCIVSCQMQEMDSGVIGIDGFLNYNSDDEVVIKQFVVGSNRHDFF